MIQNLTEQTSISASIMSYYVSNNSLLNIYLKHEPKLQNACLANFAVKKTCGGKLVDRYFVGNVSTTNIGNLNCITKVRMYCTVVIR